MTGVTFDAIAQPPSMNIRMFAFLAFSLVVFPFLAPLASPLTQQSELVIEVPFTMAGNMIAVDVVVNGRTCVFLLDTGAPRVILNAAHYPGDSDSGRTSVTKGIGGAISGVGSRMVNALDFAGLQLSKQRLTTMDLSHLESELDTEIHGLIGYRLIKDYDLMLDYEAKMIRLIDPEHWPTYHQKVFSGTTIQSVPFQMSGHIPVLKARIGDQNLDLGLDTGAGRNVISIHLFDALKPSVSEVEADSMMGADKNIQVVNRGVLSNLHLGKRTFDTQRSFFSNIDHLNQGGWLPMDGIIGYQVLARQKTLISYRRRELVFIID